MKMDQGRHSERSSRAALLSGAAVALVAVIGVDLAAASAMSRSTPRPVPTVVRAASASMPATLDAGSALGWVAVVLLALVLLRRSLLPLIAGSASLLTLRDAHLSHVHILQRRRFARSYRAGGRCGP